ncbi:MAG: GNAT family N-acetyltransferase [Deltaproteobacteria bacterium]|nr:GNAT family N-acetyltransferase [Deltaproteobacteria bacterium]
MIHFEKIKPEDARFIFRLRNERVTRQMSLKNSRLIGWKTHKAWFEKTLQKKDCFFWSVFFKGKRIGLVRFDEGIVSIHLLPRYRGKKLGSPAICEATKLYCKKRQQPAIALINPMNVASIKAFEKAGYVPARKIFLVQENGKKIAALKYIYRVIG